MKYNLTILLVCLASIINAQDSLKLEDLKAPTSPGFALLDISPTSIERPTSPKLVGLNFLNLINNGSSFPKNFAIEFAPFWLTKQRNETIFKYLSLKDKNGKANSFSGITRKFSISFATYFNDSTKNFLPKTNYTSFGARTNLVTLWGVEREKQVNKILEERAQDRLDIMDDPQLTADEIEEKLTEFRNNKKNQERSIEISNVKPLFVIDAAYAYSDSYKDNKFENKRFNRSAIWANANVNVLMNKEDNDYLYLIFYYRHTWDNVLRDPSINLFRVEKVNDVGIRIGYERKNFTLSLEHVKRNAEIDARDFSRTVGILQFRVSNNLYLLGTFGRNFGFENNLFSLLGLNWALGSNAVKL